MGNIETVLSSSIAAVYVSALHARAPTRLAPLCDCRTAHREALTADLSSCASQFPPLLHPLHNRCAPLQCVANKHASLQVYWVTGLETDAGRFFCFWGILVGVQLYSSSLYRLIGSTVRAIVAGVSVAVVVMLLTFLGSGFVLFRVRIRCSTRCGSTGANAA